MDSRFFPYRDELRDELHNVHVDLRQVQATQNHHAERLLRLEKRQQDDASIKSVWNSPFPTTLSGTPQHDPVQLPPGEMFDLNDDVNQTLNSLHLEPEDEPTRRGAASRANSVRFDESANWGANTRHSGDFGLSRPSSGLAMERSSSHKSDGRHSSAGHSVHSVHSIHSLPSGRATSLALDTMFSPSRHGDESLLEEIADPPASLFFLDPAPALIRCWLTTDFVSDKVFYAAICSGAQRSLVNYTLLQDLDLVEQIERDVDGINRVSLHVYLTEAQVAHPQSRSPNPVPQMPSLSVRFEVVGMNTPVGEGPGKKQLMIFLGSDVLRAHNVDLLFSQNIMTFYNDERDKHKVPFARPDDESLFKNLATTVVLPERPKLNAAAAEFIFAQPESKAVLFAEKPASAEGTQGDVESQDLASPRTALSVQSRPWGKSISISASDSGESDRAALQSVVASDRPTKDPKDVAASGDGSRRESSGPIWSGSWRQGAPGSSGEGSQRENGLSGYRPAGPSRNMKVLKSKSGASSTSRMVSSHETASSSHGSGELRRKSQGAGLENGAGGAARHIHWTPKKSLSQSISATISKDSDDKDDEAKHQSSGSQDMRNVSSPFPRSSKNVVGGASAFSWMKPDKSSAPAATPVD